jgi:hypothetical protein
VRPLWLSVVRASGRPRAALVIASTAVVSGLLLVAVSIARLGGQRGTPYEPLLGPIGDPGTRPGAILAVVLVAVPVALLLDQCVRLGSGAQQRRYRALALAGATRRDLGRWGAVETGVPAFVGAAGGLAVWLFLRLVLGEILVDRGHAALVPTETGPGPWAVAVVAATTLYGVLVGWRAVAHAASMASVRQHGTRPRPSALVLVLVAVLILVQVIGRSESSGSPASGWILLAVVLAIVGVMGATPWLAYVVSGVLAGRAARVDVLLASRRIRADSGAAGRAAAAVGAVGLTLGVLGVFVTDIVVSYDGHDSDYYLVPAAVVAGLALLALGVIALSLSLHSIESTLDRRREMAALVATGVPVSVVVAAHRVECQLVTLPLTVVTALAGALACWSTMARGPEQLLGGLVALLLATGSVLVAARLANRVVRPWLYAAVRSDNLRTE